MSEQWKYQVRVVLDDEAAKIARQEPSDAALEPLAAVLAKHDAELSCQYDAFAGYVAAAEEHGIDEYPLYQWTKDTIEQPAKKARYIKSFTLYVGGEEIYAGDKANALESDLQALVGGDIVVSMAKHDTNPTNNPQPPAKYRK